MNEKKCSPDSEFALSASWCDENNQLSDNKPEKFLFPVQKVATAPYYLNAQNRNTWGAEKVAKANQRQQLST